MEKFVIIHNCKYGKNLESHILVAERDYNYVDFIVRYRQWDNKITEKKLWQIDDKRWNNVYVESEEDFEAIKQVQRNRSNERYEIERCRKIKELPATANKIGLLLVRRIKGYKGTTFKQITKVEHLVGFGYDVYVYKNGRNEQHGFRTVKTR